MCWSCKWMDKNPQEEKLFIPQNLFLLGTKGPKDAQRRCQKWKEMSSLHLNSFVTFKLCFLKPRDYSGLSQMSSKSKLLCYKQGCTNNANKKPKDASTIATKMPKNTKENAKTARI